LNAYPFRGQNPEGLRVNGLLIRSISLMVLRK
jgi:hypothetical protein